MPAALRNWLSGLAWFGIGFAIALFWGELFTRILLPQNVDTVLDILYPDSIVGYVYEPGAQRHERGRGYDVPFSINSLGLRDREYQADGEDRFRVLLVGDSFSVSHGESIQNSLSRQLERALQSEASALGLGCQVEVINSSNAGYTPYNYWKAYQRWQPVFQPDLVLIGFFTGNDYVCEDEDVQFLIQDGLVAARYKPGEIPKVRQKSRLQILRKKLARGSELYILLRNFLYYNERVDRLFRKNRGAGGVALEQIQPFLVPEPKRVEEGWEKAFTYMARLLEDTREDGTALALMRIPVKLEVDEDRYRTILSNYQLTAVDLNRAQPAQRIAGYCHDLDIPFFDPLSVLRELHPTVPCFFEYDDHWNAAGMAVASRFIVSEWRAQALRPFDQKSNAAE